MIKVVVGHKLRVGADIQPVLMKLRSHALTYPGFVSAENLVNTKDSSIVFVLYTWNKIEDWRLWEDSAFRKKALKEAEAQLCEQSRVNIYRVMLTNGWKS